MDVHEVMVGQSKKFVEQSRSSYRPFAINRWNDVAKYSSGDEFSMVEVDWNGATPMPCGQENTYPLRLSGNMPPVFV